MLIKHVNKFLTFVLGVEYYGIPILGVKEIIGMMDITKIPKMPDYFRGVVNLRGRIIPVIELRIKFGMPEYVYDDRTCIVVVEVRSSMNQTLVGFIVDAVSEVLDIPPTQLEPLPLQLSQAKNAYFSSLGKTKDKVIMVIDAQAIFIDSEALALHVEQQT